MDDSANGRYDMILGWDLLTKLGLDLKLSEHVIEGEKLRSSDLRDSDPYISDPGILKLSEHVIEGDDGTFNGSTTPMVDLGAYIFKCLNTGKIAPEELFTNAHAEELYYLEHVCTATKTLRVILYAKYG